MPTTMPAAIQPLADLFNRAIDGLIAQGTTVMVLVAVGVGLLGVAMLLWGRILHRAVLVLIAFPMGMGLGAILAEWLKLNVWLGVFPTAVTLTIMVIVLARVVWALLAGFWLAIFAAVLTGLLLLGDLSPATQPGWNPTPIDLARSAWAVNNLALVAAFVGAGVAGLILGLFLPRATVIAVTSMIGASILSDSAVWLTGLWAPNLLARMAESQWLTTSAFVGVLLLGILYQSVREVRAKRAEAQAKADDCDAPRDIHKPPKPAKAGGK